MEGKKISFGFMKTKKVEKPIVEEKKEYIDCVEEKSIKVVGGESVKENTPLVIPMKPNTLVTAERLKQIAEEVEKAVQEEPEPGETSKNNLKRDENTPENETLDQMAVRELMQEATIEKKIEEPNLVVPIPAVPISDGQKESTLDDYEAVPIQEFGMAMLRGMGWNPGKEQSKYKQPQLRPKGLGLGADKVIKENQKINPSKDKDEELSIVSNAFVKIIIGKYNGCYGKVVSLDEDNGRVMVDIPVKKETVSLSEFMMQPVTKYEFDKQSRVINADTFEDYKRNEQSSHKSSSSKHSDLPKNNESPVKRSSDLKNTDVKREDSHRSSYENSSNGRSRDKDSKSRKRRDSSSSQDRSRQRRKEKYSSTDSLNSVSDSDRRRNYKEDRRRDSSSSESSDSYKKHKKNKKHKRSTPDGKRDIDKKRKGKKKKRDRDRSPNYKKQKSRK